MSVIGSSNKLGVARASALGGDACLRKRFAAARETEERCSPASAGRRPIFRLGSEAVSGQLYYRYINFDKEASSSTSRAWTSLPRLHRLLGQAGGCAGDYLA
eukprot:16430837-Heterocapsa_arctica.AAC.1